MNNGGYSGVQVGRGDARVWLQGLCKWVEGMQGCEYMGVQM